MTAVEDLGPQMESSFVQILCSLRKSRARVIVKRRGIVERFGGFFYDAFQPMQYAILEICAFSLAF